MALDSQRQRLDPLDELPGARGGDGRSEVAKQLKGVGDRIEVLPDRVLIYSDNGEAELAEIIRRGLEPITSLVRRSSLEDVFLRLTGRSLIE